MSEPELSIPDIAEQLMHEFHGVCSVAAVTEVVIRLSRAGADSVATLAETARQELGALTGALTPAAGELLDAVAP